MCSSIFFLFTPDFLTYKMALSKCCCCVDLRTGSIIIAVLGVLASISNWGSGWVVGVVTIVVGVPANLCLLHGAIKYNRTTTLIWLVMEVLFIIVNIVWFCLIIVALCSKEVSVCWDNWDEPVVYGGKITACSVTVAFLVSMLVVIVIGTGLSIYFWVCVYSFFQDLKRQQFPQPA